MTEYHNIYKVMRDSIWASIEVFNNVRPRLGGLHTIMNNSGSVGNLWWCRQNAIPDLIKHSKTKLLLPLHEVLCKCWQEGAVPQDTRDSNIITIYKNKGESNDCNNYRGISLRSIVVKVFARVILIRLQKLAGRNYPGSQCSFRAERSTIDMIFSLRQLQEKCREQHMPLYIAFIDLTKAFDLDSRYGLFKLLPKIGCPPKLQSMIESFHTDTKGTVQFNGSFSEPFEIRSGVKQGCVLAPMLFGTFFVLLLKRVSDTTTEGIYFRTRSDDRLFNLARLRAKTNVRKELIRDMLFADDAAVATHTEEELLQLMDRFSQACKDFGLTISLDRTHKHRRSLAFTTTNSMLSASSPTSAPPSLTTSHWTQRSARGLGRQLQLSLVARLE